MATPAVSDAAPHDDGQPFNLNNKRPREEPNDDNEEVTQICTMRIDAEELRASVAAQYGSHLMADMTVSVRSTSDDPTPKEFPCSSARLATASEMIGAMLFGPLAHDPALLDKPRAERVLHLIGHDHVVFKQMLDFIHGERVQFTPDSVPNLYMLADFFGVRTLLRACCKFWFSELAPETCVRMLNMAKELNCAPLVDRANDMLRLCFHDVLMAGANLKEMDEETLRALLASDALVCRTERDVMSFLFSWCFSTKTGVNREALERMLDLVRWDRIVDTGKSSPDDAPPPEPANPTEGEDAKYKRAQRLQKLCRLLSAEVDKLFCIDAAEREASAEAEGPPTKRVRCATAVSDYFLNIIKERVARAHDGEHSRDLSKPAPLVSRPRQYTWGGLRCKNPPAPNLQPFAPDNKFKELRGGLDCTVGRSRSCTISLHRNGTPPYFLSSTQFKITSRIVWAADDPNFDLKHDVLYNGDNRASGARLVAVLEDRSSNGTYVNKELVGKGKCRKLVRGDKINMVITPGQEGMAGYPNHREPHFVFLGPMPMN